jgi:hypothetical protein
MRQNQTHPCLAEAQPVVGPVPQLEDEPDVSHVGTAPHTRLSLVPNTQSPIP